MCKPGYTEINGECLNDIIPPGPNPPSTGGCNVANYFSQQQGECVPCFIGCLSCTSSYQCTQCHPDFEFDPISNLCLEICGDGKRYVSECDDGNEINGDGCSESCLIEDYFHCVDGSPTQNDYCSNLTPHEVTMISTGQVHTFGRIQVNVKLNYVPRDLIFQDCTGTNNLGTNHCRGHVLSAQVISGDQSVSSIKVEYVQGTTFSFNLIFEYGREPIGAFEAVIGINPQVASYFGSANTSNTINIPINPAYLAVDRSGSGGKRRDILA